MSRMIDARVCVCVCVCEKEAVNTHIMQIQEEQKQICSLYHLHVSLLLPSYTHTHTHTHTERERQTVIDKATDCRYDTFIYNTISLELNHVTVRSQFITTNSKSYLLCVCVCVCVLRFKTLFYTVAQEKMHVLFNQTTGFLVSRKDP